ncbi:ribokinase [uncultured Veillonella sp.]|uniref:ribokinase n=1 Tax=uncultured Veillonella sp. TaxID=159268 RepID=UPI0026216F47|nr:ribokinase [uncultured Veillonella sp.]
MNNIVVIGSCNIDITVLADKRPAAGETILGQSLHVSPGGKGANQAVAAAKLGANVTMVGYIGDDPYGQMILDNLHQHHINTDYIVTLPDETSGTAHITLAEGDNSIIVIQGANARVDETVVDKAWDAIMKADLVMLQNEIPLSTITYITKKCAAAGIKVLLNPAPAAQLDRDALENATYVTPNEHELSALYPGQEIKDTMLAHAGKIIVTLGSEGVGYAEDGELRRVPSFKVEPVDTTGAGDTFNGAFATAIVNNKSLAEAIHYGNAAAALSILKLGAQEGMPTALEVTSFLESRK